MINPYTVPLVKTNIKFDITKLRADYDTACELWPATEKWNRDLFNLRKPGAMADSEAMLYGTVNKYGAWIYQESAVPGDVSKIMITQQQFDSYCDWVKPLYLHDVCTQVESLIKQQYELDVGRNRFVTMRANRCLHLHNDPDTPLRFHVPIITNNSCFFIIENRVYRMDEPGRLYILNVNKIHTAVNSSEIDRVHIIWDAYYNM